MRILLGLLLLSSMAHAGPYKRTTDVKIDVKQTFRTRPPRPTAQKAAPVVTADDLLAVAVAAEPLRKEQQEILIGLVRDTPDDDPDKPDFLFRLAEQYAAQLRVWSLKAAEFQIAHPE
jgi:hypothetical protein